MTKTLLYAVACAAVLTVMLAGQAVPGRLLVLNKEDATFVIVDPESGAILGKVPVGQGPHELITSTDGKSEWGTVGVSENIIEASLEALVDSMEFALLKK